jgi:beta-alanine degradation protein BauB
MASEQVARQDEIASVALLEHLSSQYSRLHMSLSHYPPAERVVQIDNESVRVTRWHFPVESSTGHHRHDYDYVVVPLSTGHLLVRSKAGQSSGELATGEAYFRQSGVEHEVINDNNFEITFVEIELKTSS